MSDSDSDSEPEVPQEAPQEEFQGLDPLLATYNTIDHVFDAQFNPRAKVMATAQITGQVEMFKYDLDEGQVEQLFVHDAHRGSCRAVRWLSDGSAAVSVSAAKTVVATDAESKKRLWQKKAGESCNALLLADDNCFVVGDDEGHTTYFDSRQPDPVWKVREHEEFISEFSVGKDNHSLLSCGGDGTLAVLDLRKKGKLVACSDPNDDEFLSLAVMKNGKKVLCGSQSGTIAIFSWGDWGDMKDRLVGVPTSCDSIAKISEDLIVTGSADGILRVVSVHPNKVRGVLGEHINIKTHSTEPIETVSTNKEISCLASCGHDNTVKLWSLDEVHNVSKGKKSKVVGQSAAQNFFAGL